MQSYNSRRSFTELADLRLIYYGVSCCRLGERVKSCCQHISVHGGCPWRRVSLCLTVVSVSFVSSGLTYCPAAQRGWSDTSQLSRTPARRREDILRLRYFLLCANNNTCIIHIVLPPSHPVCFPPLQYLHTAHLRVLYCIREPLQTSCVPTNSQPLTFAENTIYTRS